MFFLINLKKLYLFVAFFMFVLIYMYAKNPHHSSASCFWPDPEVAQTQLHPYWKQSITRLLLKLSVSNFFIHPCNLWEIKIMHPQKSSTEDRVKFPAKPDGPATLVSLFRDLYMYCNCMVKWLSKLNAIILESRHKAERMLFLNHLPMVVWIRPQFLRSFWIQTIYSSNTRKTSHLKLMQQSST